MAEIEAILRMADNFFDAGWTAKALEVYRAVADAGIEPNRERARRAAQAGAEEYKNIQALSGHEQIAVIEPSVLSTLHFARQLTEYQKRVAFRAIHTIDLETSSQCNRRCHYCPNSKHDRLSSNTFMSDTVFTRVIEDLAAIDYCGALHFHGYNEPLMHIENLAVRIREARARLPRARLGIYTNGDYLDAETYRVLEECGIQFIMLSIHLAPGKAWNENEILDRVMRKGKELNLEVVRNEYQPGTMIRCTLTGGQIQVNMQEWNYAEMGSTRGGALSGIGVKAENRTEPCFHPLNYLMIGYKGDVVPCCDFVTTIAEHRDYIIGNVAETSLFDIYTGEKGWRRRCNALSTGPKMAPCDRCAGGVKRNLSPDVQAAIAQAVAAFGG
jgi:radical SAM protein with 4Fe4S-binding SPASM domain